MRFFKITLLFHCAIVFILGFLIYKPIAFRLSLTPAETVYTYQHRIHEDYFFYLMVIRQGRDGFLEYDQYTTEPTNPTAMHLYYLTLGQIGKVTGLSDITMYYLGLFVGLILVYIFTWKLSSLFFSSPYNYIAMTIITFASPFPIMNLNLLGSEVAIGTSWWTNMDLYSRITQVPHHFVGQGLMLMSLYYILTFINNKRFIFAILSAVASCIGIVFYSVPLVIFLTSAMITFCIFTIKPIITAVKKKSLKILFFKNEKLVIGIMLILLLSGAALLFVQSILRNPGWPWSTFLTWEADWYNHKTEIYPYTTFVYLISFGVLPIFMLPGFYKILQKLTYQWVFIFFLFITPILLYLAATYHIIHLPKIRFIHSTPYVFAGLIATLGIQTLVELIKLKQLRIIVASIIILIFSWNIFSGIQSYWIPELKKFETPYNTYIPKPYFTIIEYLNKNTKPFSNIYTSYAIGAYLPAFTKNNAYVGHMVSTSNFWSKYSETNSFYAHQATEDNMRNVFKTHNIVYVLGEERGLLNTYKNILTPVFSVGDLTLYAPVY